MSGATSSASTFFLFKGWKISFLRNIGGSKTCIIFRSKNPRNVKTDVRKQCADSMQKEKQVFRPYVEVVNKLRVKVKNFDDHIFILRRDAEWGG